ncbi:Hypothetical protein PHPALM_14172 [Phytophthora palmivora]|uniref:Uncharacterized protein n=1 Tax=Phytophthora palmivora TaxID=4796 RepID=A0A2P4XVF0_9STRA|nr:Hypothetical protein PHPALM_14172 [Phytophthora palmivora]
MRLQGVCGCDASCDVPLANLSHDVPGLDRTKSEAETHLEMRFCTVLTLPNHRLQYLLQSSALRITMWLGV